MLNILKIVAAIGAVLVGTVALLNPTWITGFTGLDVAGNARGITEVRAVARRLFHRLGLGAAHLACAG